MATSKDVGSNGRKTDRTGDPDKSGFDQFYNNIIQYRLNTGLVDCLVSRCILTIQEADRIREEYGQINQNKLLLNVLKERPYNCFGYFVEASVQTNTITDGDILNKMKGFKIKGNEPDVKFTNESLKIEDFQVRLQKSYKSLVEQMSYPVDIADILYQSETLTNEDIEDIGSSINTKHQKIRKILSKVASKGKSGYASFLRALKESDDSEDTRLLTEMENMEVTNDDKLMLQIGSSYQCFNTSSDRDLQNIQKDIEAMKMESIPENRKELIKLELEKWQKYDEIFIPTRAVDDIYTKIRNYNCVTVTGNSGMGKTMAVRHVALKMLAEGYTIVPITHPDEMVVLFSAQKKTLFVLDDLCGKYTLNQNYVDRLTLILETLKLLLDKKFCKIISSCRLQVYKDVKFSLSVFKECECNLKSKHINMTREEVEKFATKYFGQHAREAISELQHYDYFPFLCKLYHNQKHVNFNTFCKNPFQFIGEEVDNLLLEGDEGKYKYCVLVLCIIHNNQLTEKALTGKIDKDTRKMIKEVLEECELNRGTSPKCLHKALQTLDGTFLTNDKNCYRMLHDKLFDFVSYHIGQKMTDTLIEHADIAFLRERFVWDSLNTLHTTDFTINLPDDVVDLYIKRIITDWRKKNIVDFSTNRNLKSSVFVDKVLSHLNNLGNLEQIELVSKVDKGKLQSTPLISCCYEGNLKLTKWLLQHGANVNQCRSDDVSALYFACQEGYLEIVRELLQYKPDVNKCNDNGWSPLNTACDEGHVEVVRELLLYKADINKCDNNGWSPLNTACDEGHIEIVRELLLHKADVNKCNNNGFTPLNTACEKSHVEIVRELLQHKPDINKSNDGGWSPLNTACQKGYEDIVRQLLQHKSDINKCNNHGNSPLQIACFYNHRDIVVELLKHDVMLDLCDKDGDTALLLACEEGHTELVKLLIERGADVNKCSNTGESPLLISCVSGNIDIVGMLLNSDADINLCILSKDAYKEEILKYQNIHWYTRKKFWEEIKLVGSIKTKEYTEGDDWIINKTAGASPLHLACFMGHDIIVNLLLNKGADVNTTTDDGTTPLLLACEIGDEYIVNLLLSKGTEVSLHRHDGKSPYSIALENGHASLASLLPI